jgi:hypothetical protein
MNNNLHRFQLWAHIVGSLLVAASTHAGEAGSLDQHLEAFRPYLGKTWRGQFKDARPDKPAADIARWERALNGKAVRVLHSVNDGAYGGESLIFWDKEKSEIRYYYFTTAGFHTTGTMAFAGGKLTAVEKVSGNPNGITEVRSTYELHADGTLLSKAEYLKNGQPAGGREIRYSEAPKAEVRFR